MYTITCVEGFKREDEYERRGDDIPSKTISYGRKKDITSMQGKEEHNVKAIPVTPCYIFIKFISKVAMTSLRWYSIGQ